MKMAPAEERQKTLFVGQERICKQIAYVLDIPDYVLAEKLTPQNLEQYRDYQIYVCAFKRKSRKLVAQKLLSETPHNVQFLDDICRSIDEAYDANRKRHERENNLQHEKNLPVIVNQPVQKPLLRRVVRGMKHPLRASWHVVLRIKETVKRHQKTRVRKGSFKYLQQLKPSELLLYVLRAPVNHQIQCTRLETHLRVYVNGEVTGCCSAIVPFGNLLYDGELDEIYNSTYARIVKLSSLNHSFCLCNFYARCKGYCSRKVSTPTEHWQTSTLPKYAFLSIDRSCNLCCKACRKKPYVMDHDAQQRITTIVTKLLRSGWLEQIERVELAGSGETFYSPYYRQLLTTDLQRKSICILSNGTLFNEENWRLLAGKYSSIDVRVSVDAATAETYQKLRGADFNQLLKNLTMLGDLHRKHQIRNFAINFVVQRDNFRDMPAFVELGRSLGADRVNFQRLNNLGTFTPQEFLEHCLIIENKYLAYELWCLLQDPIFKDPIVDLKILQRYIDASERRYRRRYEREQKRRSV